MVVCVISLAIDTSAFYFLLDYPFFFSNLFWKHLISGFLTIWLSYSWQKLIQFYYLIFHWNFYVRIKNISQVSSKTIKYIIVIIIIIIILIDLSNYYFFWEDSFESTCTFISHSLTFHSSVNDCLSVCYQKELMITSNCN